MQSYFVRNMEKPTYMSPEAVIAALEKCICLDSSIGMNENGNTEPIGEDTLDW